MSCILPLALLAFATPVAPTLKKKMIDVTAYGARPDSKEDATVPFQKAIQAVREAKVPATLVIPKGRYDFFSTHAIRRACYYSNATERDSDAVRKIAIDLSDCKALTVEGNGSEFVMRGAMTMFVAERCQDLTIRNLKFDFERPTVSEITAVEKGKGYWIGKVHPDSTYRIEGGRIEWFGEDWSGGHNLVQHYDPVTESVWRGSDPTASATSVIDTIGRRIQFTVPPDTLAQVVVGRTYQFRDTRRSETGMWFNRSRNVSMRDVQVRSMAGFGVLFQYTENIDLRRIRVAPVDASGRTCASAADILHFSGCRGKIVVADSILTAAHDDAINIHGTHLQVVDRPAERQIRVRFMHDQTWGFAAFAPGDEIEFVKRDTLLPYAGAKVRTLDMTEDRREQILTLDRPVPAGVLLKSDVVENTTWTPSVEIANCMIAKVPTRGVLVTTRRPVRIVGNRFLRTPMPSILLEDDAAGWFESGAVHDLLIEGNSFVECASDAIQINPQNSVHQGAVHRNICIEGNRFQMATETAISAKSTARLRVSGNYFLVGRKSSERELVKTKDSIDVLVKKNKVFETPDRPLTLRLQ